MKLITLKIPDNKYAFFLELIKNLGFEKIKDKSSKSKGKQHTEGSSVASLRGKLNLSKEQYLDFQQHLKVSREEWDQRI